MDNMDSAKSQLVERLKAANSVLITVSRDPSVDQLAACIGLTLLINKLDKHGSAVFSGQVPSTIEFLKPEETLEATADSLRDFIIALDKSKADKLRYKVEDQLVKIFITPYRTSLTEDDLEFSQGDFNVDLVIALGVKRQEDLDEAIIGHGRILHDAAIACINTTEQSDLGAINWQDSTASSLCELVADLAEAVGKNNLDEQIATCLLTGIIAETDRFSNQKTSPQSMSVSGRLMSAGANQQLVATNLGELNVQSTVPKVEEVQPDEASNKDGTLTIDHNEDLDTATLTQPSEAIQAQEPAKEVPPEPSKEDDSALSNTSELTGQTERLVTEPPTLGGTLTANTQPEGYDPTTDPLSNIMAPPQTMPQPTEPPAPAFTPPPPTLTPPPPPTFTPPPPTWVPPTPPEPPATEAKESPKAHDNQTLTDLEEAVNSPHIREVQEEKIDSARDMVEAIKAETPDNKPDQDIGALPLGGPLHEDDDNKADDQSTDQTNTTGLSPELFSEVPSKEGPAPPVPPPILDLGDQTGSNDQTKTT